MDRNVAIETIKKALRRRSGKSWSVRGGKGTAWGWIRISCMPKHCDKFGRMPEEAQKELAKLLGKEWVHQQGESIPAANDYYQEYLDRAEGREPTVIGQRYWD